MTAELAKDRAALFPVFARDDFGILQESGRSELRAFLQGAEEGFLRAQDEGPFETVGVAERVGFGKAEFPRIWKW